MMLEISNTINSQSGHAGHKNGLGSSEKHLFEPNPNKNGITDRFSDKSGFTLLAFFDVC
jgi:hypothetical protein